MHSTNVYKSLVMEIRPRLQSVNVYINLNKDSQIEINLDQDNIVISNNSIKQKVHCNGFQIVPNSLSNVINTDDRMSFRFLTENIKRDLGTSKFEILQTYEVTDSKEITYSCLKSELNYSISCKNCLQYLCNNVSFKRVLPLPENLDTNNWFCHGHANAIKKIEPNIEDAFYTEYFVLFNKNLLNGIANANCNLICKRCLAIIGLLHQESHKIWLNTLIIKDNDKTYISSPLEDCFKIINHIFHTSLITSERIMFTCRNSESTVNYLLLWILEKQLKIHIDSNLHKIDANVAKVLFKFENSKSGLVNKWIGDLNINIVDISQNMIVKLLKTLYEMNCYIPKDFSTTNNFYISYLMIHDKK